MAMRLQDLIAPESILLDLRARDKWEAIGRMVSHLVAVGALPPRLEHGFHEAVLQRERSMSTGMERGIAIPHAAVDGLERVVACLAIVSQGEGVNFDSIDGSPAWLIVLLIIPRPQKLLHIRTLADVSRLLGNEDVRRALRQARTAAEAWAALAPG
jgi:mannitol/fructose-specific phosphotransferase system IIA component (Ntr-type)